MQFGSKRSQPSSSASPTGSDPAPWWTSCPFHGFGPVWCSSDKAKGSSKPPELLRAANHSLFHWLFFSFMMGLEDKLATR